MPGLRDSLDLIRMVRPDAGTAALEYEINAERASSLGAAEARARKALEVLGENRDSQDNLAEAREAVWSYFVQRELIGFRQHHDVIRDLAIPAKVLNGLGAMTGKRG